MIEWFTSTTLGKIIATFGISMLPVIELRGGIPVGVELGLNPWLAFLVAMLGNLAPIPFILLLLDKILEWMKTRAGFLGKTANWLERKAYKNQETIEKYKALGLIILVAIPFPGTGAWTGALVATVLRINRKTAFPCIVTGVIIAGIVVTAVWYGFSSLLA